MGSQIACIVEVGDYRASLALDLETTIPGHESCCGSDAFYRDAFLEYEEPAPRPTLTAKALEQAQLKARKGKVFMQHAMNSVRSEASQIPVEFKRKFSYATSDSDLVAPRINRQVSGSSASSRTAPKVRVSQESTQLLKHGIQSLTEWKHASPWAGKTIPEWTEAGIQSAKVGPCWKKGDGAGLPIRGGIDWKKSKEKCKSQNHMYDALTLDAIRSDKILGDAVGSLVDKVPPPSEGSLWTADCPLPRVICIHLKLPYYNPKTPWAKEDGGCSFVGFFEISNQTIMQLSDEQPPSHVRLFKKFCEGPCGKPGQSQDPNRSLNLRRNKSKTKDSDTGIFKAVGWCENEDELGVPNFLRQFNGKSFVITDSGYVVKDPAGEWLEMGFDVRCFPILFKDALYTFRNMLPKAQYHIGFLLQASEEDYLPEALLCDIYLSGVSITETPWQVAGD